MLERNVDMALLGNNYFSFLLSLNLLERGQKVLLLDDKRVSYGKNYSNKLCQWERNFLEIWGVDKKIDSLINFEKYLKQQSLTFHVGEKRIRLGGKASENYVELVRKFPNLLKDSNGQLLFHFVKDEESRELFDKSFLILCRRLAESSYRLKDLRGLASSSFLDHCPSVIREAFELFLKNLKKEFSKQSHLLELKTLIYLSRGFYQKKLATFGGDFEIFHVFISLLSPFYHLDEERFLKELVADNKSLGGQFKRTHVREWRFYKNRPWCMELASYEGIIHPKRISLLGGELKDMPLKVKTNGKFYTCLNVTWKLPADSLKGLSGERWVFSELEKIGTDSPLWEASFDSDLIHFQVFIRKEKGVKISFLKEKVQSMLEEEFFKIVPDLRNNSIDYDVDFGPEIWPEEESSIREDRALDHTLPQQIILHHYSKLEKSEKLKDVSYLGPYQKGGLGILSSLMEIKDVQRFL